MAKRCVPLASAMTGWSTSRGFAGRLGMPVVHDERHQVWAAGPEARGCFLQSAVCPEIVLPDLDGSRFDVASLRGQKVLPVVWAVVLRLSRPTCPCGRSYARSCTPRVWRSSPWRSIPVRPGGAAVRGGGRQPSIPH